MSEPLKIALVGCGRIATNHLQAIQALPDFKLTAVCDINLDAANQVNAEYGVSTYDNLQSLLTQESLDIVSLCTPSGLHAEQAIAVARAGVHVMTEKPMATEWRDGLRMLNACKQAGVRLFVVKQNRFNATLQRLKQAIEQQRFGKIYLVNINVFWTRPQAYYDQAAWRGTWRWDGGAFMNQASHYVDLLHWLFGSVDCVQAMTATLARQIEAEDSGVVNLRWHSGALGSMNVTMLTYPKNLEGSITVIGEKGTVKVTGVAVNHIEHWEFAEPLPEDASINEANYATDSVYGTGHPRYYKNVADVLLRGATPMTDGEDGLKSLELLCAIYDSAAQQGQPVYLPLERELV